MIFQHTIDKVLSGEKVQTRRLVKPNQSFDEWDRRIISNTIRLLPLPAHMTGKKKTLYQVGRTYAVQPARTAKAVARIRITDIRREDARYISYDDAKAEGFYSEFEFLWTWTQMHDKPAWNANQNTDFSDGDESGIIHHSSAWMSWLKGTRPAERYQAWVLTFELVQP